MKNIFKQISIWLCAFFIVSASFFLGFTCSLMSYEYYKESNIASASIVEEDYNISSNDVDYVNFEGSNISFYRQMNTWRTFLAQISLQQVSSSQWAFKLKLSMFGDSVMFYYGSTNSVGSISARNFSTATSSWIYGSHTSGTLLYAYNSSNNSYTSTNNVQVRAWYYKNSTSPLGSIVGFDYGMYGIEGQILPNWFNFINETSTIISYFDKDGNRVCFSIGINTSNFISYDYLKPRTYNFVDSGSDNYQIGYDNGFSNGRAEGISLGRQAGYDEGFSSGQSQGYSIGYSDGVESANNYSFLGLFGAIIDAPVKAFTSLFDYELLGFNIKSFLMALLTCSIVIWLIKVVTGKAGG